ncbi:hypothetical protein GN956_G13650 [Arapaima gigas]
MRDSCQRPAGKRRRCQRQKVTVEALLGGASTRMESRSLQWRLKRPQPDWRTVAAPTGINLNYTPDRLYGFI